MEAMPPPHPEIESASEDLRVLQFKALREEILHLRGSVIKILTAGISGLPALAGFAEQFKLDIVIFAAPFMVVGFALIFISEQNSLMRVGKYIRTILEPALNRPKVVECSWEHYLEQSLGRRRHVEGFLAKAAYMIYVIYFFGAVLLAYKNALGPNAEPKFNTNIFSSMIQIDEPANLALLAYGIVFVWALLLVKKHMWLSTREGGEVPQSRAFAAVQTA